MIISEVIKRLEEIKAKEGDLPCVAHDGLDPSDPALVVDVEVDNIDGLCVAHEYGGKVAFIRS